MWHLIRKQQKRSIIKIDIFARCLLHRANTNNFSTAGETYEEYHIVREIFFISGRSFVAMLMVLEKLARDVSI